MIYLGIAGRDLAILIVGYAVLYGVGLARGIGSLKWLGLRTWSAGERSARSSRMR